jgi:arylsulfatase A-like enzyme
MIRIWILFLVVFCLSRLAFAQDPGVNIIFILTDDQRWDALGYAGNDIIQTPAMDKLAEEGTYFKNAFVTTPICAASRASIMTGLYERKHRYTFQQPPLRRAFIENSYFSLLNKAGYYNGFLGKFGVKFENNLDTTLFDIYKPEYLGSYYELPVGTRGDKHLTDRIGDNAIEFIKNAPRDQPFCLSISFYAPHAVDDDPEQYFWPRELDTLYQQVTIPDPVMGDIQYFDKLPHPVKEGFNRTRWEWRFDSPDKYQKMVKGYYRMISGIDRNIERIREELDQQGISENTIIILMGDNGYFLGERQLAGKWLMYEPSLRVPLIIYNPMGEGQKRIEDMVLNIDVTSTILDFANVHIPDTYQGVSLKSYTTVDHSLVRKRDHFLCEHLWDFEPIPPSEGIRTEQYKYFKYINSPSVEELYDIKNDPNEEINLVEDNKSRKVLRKLRKKCNSLIESVSK